MMFSRKLRALEYPNWDTFDGNDLAAVHALVVWLEKTKIRKYPADDRSHLSIFSQKWMMHFAKYLSDLSCPRPYSESMKPQELVLVLDWLLGHAISLEYHDRADEYNRAAAARLAEGAAHPAADDTAVLNDPEFRKQLDLLAAALGLPPHDDPAVLLQNATSALEQVLSQPVRSSAGPAAAPAGTVTASPAAAAAAAATEGGAGGGSAAATAPAVDPTSFPLGFTTGDPKVDRAATVLRLLYIADLRELQTRINEIIATVQEFTAQPRTDARLGKVGL